MCSSAKANSPVLNDVYMNVCVFAYREDIRAWDHSTDDIIKQIRLCRKICKHLS